MAAKKGRAYTRERTNALHALHNAGLLTFVGSVDRPRSDGGRGGKMFTIEMNGEEIHLVGNEVDAFVNGVIHASGRKDIDLTQPFAAA